jgi:hypothetical protein
MPILKETPVSKRTKPNTGLKRAVCLRCSKRMHEWRKDAEYICDVSLEFEKKCCYYSKPTINHKCKPVFGPAFRLLGACY